MYGVRLSGSLSIAPLRDPLRVTVRLPLKGSILGLSNIKWSPKSWNIELGWFALGSPILHLKGMRIVISNFLASTLESSDVWCLSVYRFQVSRLIGVSVFSFHAAESKVWVFGYNKPHMNGTVAQIVLRLPCNLKVSRELWGSKIPNN